MKYFNFRSKIQLDHHVLSNASFSLRGSVNPARVSSNLL